MTTFNDIMYEIIHKIEDKFGYVVMRSELKPDSKGGCNLYLVYGGLLNYDQLEEVYSIAHVKHTVPGRLPAVQSNCCAPQGAYSLSLQLSNLDFVS